MAEKATLHWVMMPTVFKQSYLYIGHGPSQGTLSDYWPELLKLARRHHCTYIKVEPKELASGEATKLHLKRNSYSIQPETTLKIDLTLSEEDLLKQMKPKGRYNIKVANKHNILYRWFDGQSKDITQAIEQFYQLLAATATRDHFGIHSREYYQLFLAKLFPHSRLYLAYNEQVVVAGLIATFYQNESIYYYGASSNQDRETMATYGLQWQVIKDAKTYGATTYDFLGIAPEHASENHPWYGVTTFKKKFGGYIVQYPGTYHYVCRPLVYFLIHAAKKLSHIARKLLQR